MLSSDRNFTNNIKTIHGGAEFKGSITETPYASGNNTPWNKDPFTLTSTFACSLAFASNCNIASMGCCVKCKEWVICANYKQKLQTNKKTHSGNGP